MLRLLAAAGPARLFDQTATLAAKSAALITVSLESLRKSDGAYGCGGQERSHLTPMFGVIGAYHLLKIAPPNRDTLVGDGRDVFPSLVEAERDGGEAGEYAHLFPLTAAWAKGKHTATAVVREIATKQETARSLSFESYS